MYERERVKPNFMFLARYQSGNEKAEVEKGDAKDKVNISTIITLSAGKIATGQSC